MSPKHIALMIACTLAACNQGSGVDADKRLNELSEDELRALCEANLGNLDPVSTELSSPEASCSAAGLVIAETPQECIRERDACIERRMMTDPAPVTDDASCSGSATDIPETCDITVGELEACFDAWIGVLADRQSLYDCDNAGNPAIREMLSDFGAPRECYPFFARCTSPSEESGGGA